MAIITFCSNEIKETGQTLSLAAIASYMAIEHNYKILIVPTSYNDLSLENCFWEYSKINTDGANENGIQTVGIASGVEGLVKVLVSNKTNNDIVKNYSKSILRDRLDILFSPTTKSYQEYSQIASNYINVIQMASRYYDLVLVDLSKNVPREARQEILQLSDVVIMNLVQRLKTINDFINLRDTNDFYKRRNVMLMIGRYDKSSKYNEKNVTRYIKEKKTVSVVPYNTLFLEACSEGTIIDFILKMRKITDSSDPNNFFLKQLQQIDNNIILKLQELQMKI